MQCLVFFCAKAFFCFFSFAFFPVIAQSTVDSGVVVAQRFGLDRVLLEWDVNAITPTMCDPLFVVGESGFFCDATQFSIMLSKRLVLEPDLNEFEVLLLADNYGGSFREAFSGFYSGRLFLGGRVDVSKWFFLNSPGRAGLYRVFLDSNEGGFFVRFVLVEDLNGLDSRLGTRFSENPFFGLAFDAFPFDGERDFGLTGKGEVFYLNDVSRLPVAVNDSSGLEVESGKTFADTASGLVLGFDLKSRVLRFNRSVPSVVSLHLRESGSFTGFYSLADLSGRVFSRDFFGDRVFLLDWSGSDGVFRDVFLDRVASGLRCDGWSESLPSGKLVVSPGVSDSLSFHSVVFLPEGVVLRWLCVSGDAFVELRSFAGGVSGFYSGVRNGFVSSGRLLSVSLPAGSFEGVFSLRAVLGEVVAGRVRVLSEPEKGLFALFWNEKAFRELVVTGEKPEDEPVAEEISSYAALPAGGANAPYVFKVYLQPLSPTGREDIYCFASGIDPNNSPLNFIFTWRLNGIEVQKYQINGALSGAERTQSSMLSKQKLAERRASTGTVIECEVIVNNGRTQSHPVTAKATIGQENPVGQSSGALPDSDGDGIPDASDRCPYEKGTLANQGCPSSTPSLPASPLTPSQLTPSQNTVSFYFLPIDWEGSQQSFETEVNGQLAFLLEKSGIKSDPACSGFSFQKTILPMTLAEQCGLSLKTTINYNDFLSKVYSCLQRQGIPLNNKKTIFAGLSNSTSSSLVVCSYTASGSQCFNWFGFHDRLGGSGFGTSVLIALASTVGSPKLGFDLFSHEVGHSLGFCEQYSYSKNVAQQSARQFSSFGGCTNKYPGSGETLYALLFSQSYEKCPGETIPTNCPEFVQISYVSAYDLGLTTTPTEDSTKAKVLSSELREKIRLHCSKFASPDKCISDYVSRQNWSLPDVDCLGRRFFVAGKENRDIMGVVSKIQQEMAMVFTRAGYSSNPERSFDCFEKEQFKKQWCLGG
ncbi:MAG: hypothetical protein QXK06_02060 [Candidatus Diapherotrites archaeon]